KNFSWESEGCEHCACGNDFLELPHPKFSTLTKATPASLASNVLVNLLLRVLPSMKVWKHPAPEPYSPLTHPYPPVSTAFRWTSFASTSTTMPYLASTVTTSWLWGQKTTKVETPPCSTWRSWGCAWRKEPTAYQHSTGKYRVTCSRDCGPVLMPTKCPSHP